jgi:hydrogenase maturation protease
VNVGNRPKLLVIGVGNAYRGDDAAGLLVARRLSEVSPAGVTILEHAGDGPSLIELWRDARHVILVDAANGGAGVGEIRRFDAGRQPLPAGLFHCSSHALGPVEAIELARVLGRLPERIVVYAIAGRVFDPGGGPCPEVEAAVREVVRRVLAELPG